MKISMTLNFFQKWMRKKTTAIHLPFLRFLVGYPWHRWQTMCCCLDFATSYGIHYVNFQESIKSNCERQQILYHQLQKCVSFCDAVLYSFSVKINLTSNDADSPNKLLYMNISIAHNATHCHSAHSKSWLCTIRTKRSSRFLLFLLVKHSN